MKKIVKFFNKNAVVSAIVLTTTLIIAFIILAVFIVNWIESVSLFLRNYGIEIINDKTTWLTFLGSLFGGSLTLVALVITINHSNQQNKRMLALHVLPICNISMKVNKRPIFGNIEYPELIEFFGDTTVITIEVENITDNLVRKFKVDDIVIMWEFDNKSFSEKPIGINSDLNNNILPKEKIAIDLEVGRFFEEKNIDRKCVCYIKISYTDIFNLEHREVSSTFSFKSVSNKNVIGKQEIDFGEKWDIQMSRSETNYSKKKGIHALKDYLFNRKKPK